MDISNKYSVYVGTLRGVIEYTNCKPKEIPLYTLPDEKSELTAFEWGRTENEIIVGLNNEQVHIYDTLSNKYVTKITKLEGEGAVVGVAPVDESIIAAKREGIISIWSEEKSDFFSLNLDEKGSLDCMVYNKARGDIIGTGGECNDFKLWNIETQQCVFKAKSLGHDELNLPIPTSIRGIIFLPECFLNVCATKEGHILLYDERAQRKPVLKYFEPKASYSSIASAFRDKQCLTGSTKGFMTLLDLKKPPSTLKTFKSFTGCITGIYCDPVEPLVFTTNMDRFLRVHSLDDKKLIYKVFMKQNITKLLVKPIVKEETIEDDVKIEDIKDQDVDEEYEELFDQMETIQTGEKQGKRKVQNETVVKKKKKKMK